MTATRVRPASALAFALLAVLAGCVGGPATPTADPNATAEPTSAAPGSSPTSTATPASPTPTATATPTTTPPAVAYESHVFDHGPTTNAAIEGGIESPLADGNEGQRYVTVVPTAADATRFNHSILDSRASEFVNGTDFGGASIVVVQIYPASSVPDMRVESVERDGDHLRIATNRSSAYGTDDITVETLLVRVHGDSPASVTVGDETGGTVDWSRSVSRGVSVDLMWER